MKKYAVYGVDTINALREYDSLDEAIAFAQKGLRKWGKTVRDTDTRQKVYAVRKNNRGELVEKRYI